MEDDLICSLTRQVKEEVIENYLTERCIVGLQIEDIQNQVEALKARASKTGLRLSRLAYLMTHRDMTQRLLDLLKIPADSPWASFAERQFTRGTRLIRVRAFTDKGRFKKLVLEAYQRFHGYMEDYRKTHGELMEECKAVNINIAKFQKNFDLLTILSFLKSMDTQELERKQYLGDNFTADEMASIDQKLYLPPIMLEGLGIHEPLTLPHPGTIGPSMEILASDVFRKYEASVRSLLA
ncbi:MAG: hypothetical protein MUF52_12200 [Syntrophobacteraceae bacterium]|jgi:hypothetical protein|nr:hypothetical protein [Syntrophobacteraceae bacterium]MCU0588903.1 hypothetical protein [Syntrophobacteraceae bacterium]